MQYNVTMNHETSPSSPETNTDHEQDNFERSLARLAQFALNNAETAETPADRFRVNPADYPIFSHQSSLDEHWGNNSEHRWGIDKTLSAYVSNTAELIAAIDGTSTEYSKNHELAPPDHIIYLDKSARPVSWFVNTFWSDFSDRKRPEHSYLSIDRLDWFRLSGLPVNADGKFENSAGEIQTAKIQNFDIKKLPPDALARIRALYLPDGISSEDPTEIMQTPSSLDGKNILIVDEVGNSGSTLKIAQQIVQAAFPEAASVNGQYFWKSPKKYDHGGQLSQMLSQPVWYKSDSPYGRGIGEIDPNFYAERYQSNPTPTNHAKAYGSFALARTVDLRTEPDQLSRRLMQEIKTMHRDFENGHILINPRNYDDDRIEALMAAQGVRFAPASDPSPDTYYNIKTAIDNRPATS